MRLFLFSVVYDTVIEHGAERHLPYAVCVAKALIEGPNTNNLACRVFNRWNKTCKISRNYIVATLSFVRFIGNETDTISTQPTQQNVTHL